MSKLLGARLIKQRKRLGITQQEVAEQLNLNRSTYAYYEIGNHEPSLQTIYKISLLFGVSVDELLKPE